MKYNFWLSLAVYLNLFTFNLFFTNCHRCGHHHIKDTIPAKVNLYGNEHPEISKKRYLQAAWQPIRIYFDFSTLDSQKTIDVNKREALKKIATNTKPMFESLLMVKRATTKLTVTDCPNSKATLSAEVKAGVDADLVIFPFFNAAYTGTSTEAAATHCLSDTVTNRPIAGYINYSIEAVDVQKANWLEYFTYLTFHEINHILVFNDYFGKRPNHLLIALEILFPKRKLLEPKLSTA